MLLTILHHPITHGALTGWVAAAGVDFVAFKNWKSFHDAVTYDWGIAIWRWFQGAATGALAAAGLNLAGV